MTYNSLIDAQIRNEIELQNERFSELDALRGGLEKLNYGHNFNGWAMNCLNCKMRMYEYVMQGLVRRQSTNPSEFVCSSKRNKQDLMALGAEVAFLQKTNK
jgi:hypothetical protein